MHKWGPKSPTRCWIYISVVVVEEVLSVVNLLIGFKKLYLINGLCFLLALLFNSSEVFYFFTFIMPWIETGCRQLRLLSIGAHKCTSLGGVGWRFSWIQVPFSLASFFSFIFLYSFHPPLGRCLLMLLSQLLKYMLLLSINRIMSI